MQLFRFTAAIVLVVVISLVGIAQEKRHLTLTRAISLQQYRIDQLLERQAHLRLRIHELTSPVHQPHVVQESPPPPQTAAESSSPVR